MTELSVYSDDGHIDIDISAQILCLYRTGNSASQQPIGTFSISTAVNGVGQKKDSECTPLGKHIIRAKIGAGLAANSVLMARRPTGEIYNDKLAKEYPLRDWILTRILWLSGCEKGHNRLGDSDTMQRYIYIHGTPDSEPMGIPGSHGCIRMRNQDIIKLYDLVSIGTTVTIHK